MAFVYRYIDTKKNVKYVGIVHGDHLENLRCRIRQHASEPQFRPSWKIEYISGLTRTDAEILEAHLIAIHRGSCINIAKRNWGALSLEVQNIPDWIEYNDSDILAQIKPFKLRKVAPYDEIIESYTCSCCHRKCAHYPDNYIEIDFKGWVNQLVALWLCPECEKTLYDEFMNFFAPLTRTKICFKAKPER